MVRNIVGVLIEIGKEKKDVNYIDKLLKSCGEIHNMKSSPACGLYLDKVKY